MPLKDILQIHNAMKAYGAATLLWVVQSEHYPSGTVELLMPRLIRGHVAELAPRRDAGEYHLKPWLEVCHNARRLADTAPAESADLLPVAGGAHVRDLGDIWSWPHDRIGELGSSLRIEAINILPPINLPNVSFTYRVRFADGQLSQWAVAGEVCGARGENRGIAGVQLRLTGADASLYTCAYDATFVNGTASGTFGADSFCAAPSGAELETFRITLARKLHAATSYLTPETAAFTNRAPEPAQTSARAVNAV